MSPRPGGESDKFGNRYEGAWTVRHLLLCLMGEGDSVTVEDVDDRGQSAEFTFERANEIEVHQVKRQNGNAASWTVSSINGHGIWQDIANHVRAKRRFNFVSMTPAPVLQDLAGRARRAASCSSFERNWLTSQDLKSAFTELSRADILGSGVQAWETLRGFDIRWPDERELVDMNSALAGSLLSGANGRLASVGLGDIALNNLGVQLNREKIVELLPQYGLGLVRESRQAALRQRVDGITASWLDTTAITLLEPVIDRSEAIALTETATTGTQLKFVVGDAGVGKTAVVYQAVSGLRTSGVPVLCFRLDRIEGFATTDELGVRLGLEGSPVSALAAISGGQDSVLVVDQLDAVSLASGRMPNNFDVVADLARELAAFPTMRLLLVCRKFDVDNDYRIRGLMERSDQTVDIRKLSPGQVNKAVNDMQLDSTKLTESQCSLLAYPLNLTLLSAISEQPNALRFEDAGALLDLYWDRKRRDANRRRPSTTFDEVVQAVAAEVSRRQRLSVPRSALSSSTQDALDVLVSEHVLVQDLREIAFFHEGLFDYAFARYWVSLGQSLVEFLLESEQELFRRAQVRQILSFLRNDDPPRFVGEVERLLRDPQIRYHIKQSVLAFLGNIVEPRSPEADVAVSVAASCPDLEQHLWAQLGNAPWFARLNADGRIAEWLESGSQEVQSHAIKILAGAARAQPDQVAATLSRYAHTQHFPEWLAHIIFNADVECSRPLFDLLLSGVRNGFFSDIRGRFGYLFSRVAERNGEWALELLVAHLAQRPGATRLDSDGRVAALAVGDYGLAQAIRLTAQNLPKKFSEAFLPYMAEVMAATQGGTSDGFGWPTDGHFSSRHIEQDETDDVNLTLLASMIGALHQLSEREAAEIRPYLQSLADYRCDSAQFLLYQALTGAGSLYAEWAAELLVEARERLLCGYIENSVWATRLLLLSINDSISDRAHQLIEDVVRDLRFPWDRNGPGFYAFSLLSALGESRLSEVGRRRLGEYRRRFESDQPERPGGVASGWIASPIPQDAVEYMTDANWLQAIERHRDDRIDWSRFTGGARELSALLRRETASNPDRFSRLALGLSRDAHPSYGSAILIGFADAPAVSNPEAVFQAIRHISDIRNPEHDRYVGPSLARYIDTAPIDLVELVLDRALNATDPADDRSIFASGSSRSSAEQLHMNGMNSARGANALVLGDLLLSDTNGSRTQLVVPYFGRLAADPVLAVRACVAHVLGAAFRHARVDAARAFWELIEPRSQPADPPRSAQVPPPRGLKRWLRLPKDLITKVFSSGSRSGVDDVLLTSDHVLRLCIFIGNDDTGLLRTAIARMRASDIPDVLRVGGRLSAFAGLEWGCGELLASATASTNPEIRLGVAEMIAERLSFTASREAAVATIGLLFNDSEHQVRLAAASIAMRLRDKPLRPFNDVLTALIDAPAYTDAIPQLLITLQHAPDRIDDLVLQAVRRFIESFGEEVADLSTSAAGDAQYISELVLRGLAQTEDSARRSALLDIVDSMVRLGAYGIEDAIEQMAR